jgi:hypothetical protein
MKTHLGIAMLLLLSSPFANALPRFSAVTGYKCQSCHEDPTGGALRQTLGVQYGREQLPVPDWSKDQSLEDLTNLLGGTLGVGADFSMLYFSEQYRSNTAEGFWQMQGDLYVNFKVTKKISFYLNKGLYTGFEAFALAKILPSEGFVKAGKFLPDFGTKLDDHTTFIRTYTGFSPEYGRPELTGMEAGLSPGSVSIVGGVYNSSDGFGAATTNRKAYLGRAEFMASPTEDIHLWLGANVFGNSSPQTPVSLPPGAKTTVWGAFGRAGISRLAVFGETDWIQTTIAALTTKGLVSYVEADYPLIQGVDLNLAYDFYDPDIDRKTGVIMRYSAGVEFFPLPGVELRPVYRLLRGSATNLRNEIHALIHLYF